MSNTGSIQSGPFTLSYIVEGTGIPTLVVGSALYYPRVFSQNVRNHLQMVFMDHRGFAPSPGPVDIAEFELDVLLDDMEKVRAHLNLEKIVVVGHSGHGYMALEYAKKYPEHVSHVVLIGMGPDQSSQSHAEAEQYLHDSVCPERKKVLQEQMALLPADIEAHPERRFVSYCIRAGARSWYDYTFDATPLWEGVQANMQMFDHVWGVVFRDIDITRGLEQLNVPVFLALGRYDFLVAPPASWNPIRSQFKDLTVRVFERSGHTPQYEEPELFDAELLSWLG